MFRADWDSFFRENKEMNEMKAGERPDTIKLENMPCKWWVSKLFTFLWTLSGFFLAHLTAYYADQNFIPLSHPCLGLSTTTTSLAWPATSPQSLSWRRLSQLLGRFGLLTSQCLIHIGTQSFVIVLVSISWIIALLGHFCTKYLKIRHKMKKSVAGIQTFSFGQDLVFDAFIQFKVTTSLLKKFIMNLDPDFKRTHIWISGVHWVCQVHECNEGDEAVLQGQGQWKGLDEQYQGEGFIWS